MQHTMPIVLRWLLGLLRASSGASWIRAGAVERLRKLRYKPTVELRSAGSIRIAACWHTSRVAGYRDTGYDRYSAECGASQRNDGAATRTRKQSERAAVHLSQQSPDRGHAAANTSAVAAHASTGQRGPVQGSSDQDDGKQHFSRSAEVVGPARSHRATQHRTGAH